MDTEDFPASEDGMTACAVAEPGSDSPSPPPEQSSEGGVPAIQVLLDNEEPTIGNAVEIFSPSPHPVSFPDEFVAEISAAALTFALPAAGEPIAAIEARINRGFALVSNLAHVSLRFAHELGRLLIAYKHRVGHGNFESSLSENVLGPGRSRSTVSDCMRIASVPLDDILEALDTQRSGDLSIRAVLEYLRGHEDGRPDRRRRSHQDRQTASSRGPSPPSTRHDGIEDRSRGREREAGEAASDQLTLDASDETHQTNPAPTSPPDDSSGVSVESDDRPGGDTEVNLVDGSQAPADPSLLANLPGAPSETPPGPMEIATSPPTSLGDESGVMTSFSPEVRATTVVENTSETAASIDSLETPSDQDWLERLAVRSELARTDAFDREALTWRRQHLAVQEMVARADLSKAERAQISPRTWVAHGYRSRLAYAAAVRPPNDWILCLDCHGSGDKFSGTSPCGTCRGTCFEVTQKGDDLGSPANRDGQGA